jgi:hypothetical protein
MRKLIQAFTFFLCTALVTVQTAQASNPSAGGIFNSIGGTTTIDQGGAIHSQTRSIYSLGGGMTRFEGKKVTLLAADPPSFSAGCSGISWHFGGFAFISLDEIRQMVEAVAQASLGIAVDLAMQTLCPQCYAVMSKLRDMSNMMRNAAYDACEIATKLGKQLMEKGGLGGSSSKSDCSTYTGKTGETTGWMDSMAGQACGMLDTAEKKMKEVGKGIDDFLNGTPDPNKPTPSADLLLGKGNITYKALSNLGFDDGAAKDIWLSLLGMTLIPSEPSQDCQAAFSGFYGSAKTVSEGAGLEPDEKARLQSITPENTEKAVKSKSSTAAAPTAGDAVTTEAKTAAPDSKKGPVICTAPPLLSNLETIGKSVMCGFNPKPEAERFATTYFNKDAKIANEMLLRTSMGAMCKSMLTTDGSNPLVYHCNKDSKDSADCTKPKMVRLDEVLPTATNKGYTGLVWMIGDALFDGAIRIQNNDSRGLSDATVGVLNGSGWPLYRLINMAAVYPHLASELLSAYTSAIAAQYAMDALDKLLRVGQNTSIELKATPGLRPDSITVVRGHIMDLTREGNSTKTDILARIAEKRQLVDIIMQVNKALQAEVIGQGLTGNSNMAVSLKQQVTAAAKPAAPK